MNIKLLNMRVENFMCYASKDFDFYDITKIMAENGVGKSTIATAYLWCLFNCDYELRIIRLSEEKLPEFQLMIWMYPLNLHLMLTEKKSL